MEGISPARVASIVSSESSRPASSRPRNGAAAEPTVQAQASTGEPQFDIESLEMIAAELDSALKRAQGDFSVSVDGDSGTMVVRITDKVTGEIVKQIPPQELMDADVSMEKIIGLLVDDRA